MATNGAPVAQRRPALPGRQPMCASSWKVFDTSFAQRRPALPGRQPATRSPSSPARRSPLNEGRPFRAGNPMTAAMNKTIAKAAQRRPALPGRQPRSGASPRSQRGYRSTKAGPSGPATPHPCGPGRLGARAALNEGRPFRAGNPSSRPVRCHHGLSSLNEGRPFRAGNPGGRRCANGSCGGSLNEGRPFRAGNPGGWHRMSPTPHGAQRRPALPGRQPGLLYVGDSSDRRIAQRRPALPGRQPQQLAFCLPTDHDSLNEGRPFRAGNPQPAFWERLDGHERSTKAGPSGPATRVLSVARVWCLFIRSTKAGPSGPATPPPPRTATK